MTYLQAKAIVWNPTGHTRKTLLMAVAVIIATLTAHPEDLDKAYAILGA
jgi:hypothetical protein